MMKMKAGWKVRKHQRKCSREPCRCRKVQAEKTPKTEWMKWHSESRTKKKNGETRTEMRNPWKNEMKWDVQKERQQKWWNGTVRKETTEMNEQKETRKRKKKMKRRRRDLWENERKLCPRMKIVLIRYMSSNANPETHARENDCLNLWDHENYMKQREPTQHNCLFERKRKWESIRREKEKMRNMKERK